MQNKAKLHWTEGMPTIQIQNCGKDRAGSSIGFLKIHSKLDLHTVSYARACGGSITASVSIPRTASIPAIIGAQTPQNVTENGLKI